MCGCACVRACVRVVLRAYTNIRLLLSTVVVRSFIYTSLSLGLIVAVFCPRTMFLTPVCVDLSFFFGGGGLGGWRGLPGRLKSGEFFLPKSIVSALKNPVLLVRPSARECVNDRLEETDEVE